MVNEELPFGTLLLLPHGWKIAGFIVAGAAFVAALVAGFAIRDGEVWEGCFNLVLILGMLVAALSKDPCEDEMMWQMRLAACFRAFMMGVGFVATYLLLSLISDTDRPSAVMGIMFMLMMYHFEFFLMKRRARRGKHD